MTPEQIEKDIAEATKAYKGKPRSDLIEDLVIAVRGLEKHKNINGYLVSTLDSLWLFNNHLMGLLEANGIELPAEPTEEFIALAKRKLAINMTWEHETRQFAIKSNRQTQAKDAINARHDKEGGYRDSKKKMLEFWATGIYETYRECAKKHYKDLGIGEDTARKYLTNAPEPENWIAKGKRK